MDNELPKDMTGVKLEVPNDIYSYLYKEALKEQIPVNELIIDLLDKYTGKLASEDTKEIIQDWIDG